MTAEPRRHRLGAVHALLQSIEPTAAAFTREWPQADVAHLLDGSLYLDRSRGTVEDAELSSRIRQLIRYSAATGAEGILFTGSFFGEAVLAARAEVDVPVLSSFDGLMARALQFDRPLVVLPPAPDSVTLLMNELEREASRQSRSIELGGHHVTGAMDALLDRHASVHDRLIVEAVRAVDPASAVVFAQFSMERALEASAVVTRAPVIGPATEGVAALRRAIDGPS